MWYSKYTVPVNSRILISCACSFDVAVNARCVVNVAMEKTSKVSDFNILCAPVTSYNPWTTTESLYCLHVVASNDFGVTAGRECIHPDNFLGKPVNAPVNTDTEWFKFVI